MMLQFSMSYALLSTSMVHRHIILRWAIKNNSFTSQKYLGTTVLIWTTARPSDTRHLRIHSFQLSERFVCLQWPLNSIKNCLKAMSSDKIQGIPLFSFPVPAGLFPPVVGRQTRQTMEVGYCQTCWLLNQSGDSVCGLNQSEASVVVM